eukprot:Seg149.11 transcript_id=Seg149.11/GoldUCD/mRNA.D3Y31 product="hypothetical protein" protein_id=Seg149.11/GoldUCD/D3Y31
MAAEPSRSAEPYIVLEEQQRTEETMMSQQVVTRQPMRFQVVNLDPPSQMLYNGLNSKHMSGETVSALLSSAGQDLTNNVQGKFVSLKGNMSYNELLKGLTHAGEQIISVEPHLQYSTSTIADEFGQVRETRVGGVALLTDRRMLLLSSQYFHTSSISQFGDPKKLPGGYTMEMSCKDTTYYFPISLDLFHSVEMEGRTGISGSIAVHGTPPPCGGYCGCCSLLKGWNKMPMAYSEFNETSLKLGVLMPPWQHKSFITLHVPSNVPIHYLRDFISKLQSQAKHLH